MIAHSGRFSDRIATRSPSRDAQLAQADARGVDPLGELAVVERVQRPSRRMRIATGRAANASTVPK